MSSEAQENSKSKSSTAQQDDLKFKLSEMKKLIDQQRLLAEEQKRM